MVFIPVPGTELLKPLNFLSVKSNKGVFCYVNEVTLGKHLRMGLVVRGTKLMIGGLKLSHPSSWPPPGRGQGLQIEFNCQWPMSYISHDYVESLHKTPKGQGSELFHIGEHTEIGERGTPGEGMEALCPFPIPCPVHLAVPEFCPFIINQWSSKKMFLWVLWATLPN